jgi:hypothetical protein
LFTAAIPSAAGAFGITQLDHFIGARAGDRSAPAPPISRSLGWILTAGLILCLFVGLLGPGVKFG